MITDRQSISDRVLVFTADYRCTLLGAGSRPNGLRLRSLRLHPAAPAETPSSQSPGLTPRKLSIPGIYRSKIGLKSEVLPILERRTTYFGDDSDRSRVNDPIAVLSGRIVELRHEFAVSSPVVCVDRN